MKSLALLLLFLMVSTPSQGGGSTPTSNNQIDAVDAVPFYWISDAVLLDMYYQLTMSGKAFRNNQKIIIDSLRSDNAYREASRLRMIMQKIMIDSFTPDEVSRFISDNQSAESEVEKRMWIKVLLLMGEQRAAFLSGQVKPPTTD